MTQAGDQWDYCSGRGSSWIPVKIQNINDVLSDHNIHLTLIISSDFLRDMDCVLKMDKERKKDQTLNWCKWAYSDLHQLRIWPQMFIFKDIISPDIIWH